jgi:hypothetical protein
LFQGIDYMIAGVDCQTFGCPRVHIVEKRGQRCDVADIGMRNEDVLDGLLDRERRDKSDTPRVDGNVVVDCEGRRVLMS